MSPKAGDLGDTLCPQDRPAELPAEALNPFMIFSAVTERLTSGT